MLQARLLFFVSLLPPGLAAILGCNGAGFSAGVQLPFSKSGRKLSIILFLFSSLINVSATTVTATVRDPEGIPYANGSVLAQFVPASRGATPNVNGSSFPRTVSGPVDSDGRFSITVTDDHTITPAGGRWSFTICGHRGSCFIVGPLEISGTAQDVSAQVNAAALPLRRRNSGGGSPGGSNGQVQFNNMGTFGGDPAATWDDVNKILQVASVDPFGPAGVEASGGGVASKLKANGVYVPIHGGVYWSQDASPDNTFIQINSYRDNPNPGQYSDRLVINATDGPAYLEYGGGTLYDTGKVRVSSDPFTLDFNLSSYLIVQLDSAHNHAAMDWVVPYFFHSLLADETPAFICYVEWVQDGTGGVTVQFPPYVVGGIQPNPAPQSRTIQQYVLKKEAASTEIFRATTAAGGTPGGFSQQVLSGTTSSLGGLPLPAGACASTTVTIAGAATGMDAHATPETYPGDGTYWLAHISAANTATVRVCAAVARTPTASVYDVRVTQ